MPLFCRGRRQIQCSRSRWRTIMTGLILLCTVLNLLLHLNPLLTSNAANFDSQGKTMAQRSAIGFAGSVEPHQLVRDKLVVSNPPLSHKELLNSTRTDRTTTLIYLQVKASAEVPKLPYRTRILNGLQVQAPAEVQHLMYQGLNPEFRGRKFNMTMSLPKLISNPPIDHKELLNSTRTNRTTTLIYLQVKASAEVPKLPNRTRILNGLQVQAPAEVQHLMYQGLNPEFQGTKFNMTMSLPKLIRELSEDIVIYYPDFVISKPRFLSSIDWEIFSGNQQNKDLMKPATPEKLRGVISLVVDGTVSGNSPIHTCGWKTNADEFKPTFPKKSNKHFQVLCPILVPEANTFQHFLDGALPKLVQVLPLFLSLQNVNFTILLPSAERDTIITDIMERLGIRREQMLWANQPNTYTADVVVNTCVTPPLHPSLWQKARVLLGAPPTLQIPIQNSSVILLTRAGSHNIGRHIDNFDQVSEFLSKRYGSRLVIFKGGYNLDQSISLFGKAGIIIGVHGGAFYNMNFSPKETAIIEFMPMTKLGTPPAHLAHTIVWAMANMLGQPYWRIPRSTLNDFNDIAVPLELLSRVLDRVDISV